MKVIPISDEYSQTFSIVLGAQNCQINLYQKSTGFYCDLFVNNVQICGGVICQNLNKIVRYPYLGFIGDLMFQDTQGLSDPTSPGLGTRYVFCYLEASDLSGAA